MKGNPKQSGTNEIFESNKHFQSLRYIIVSQNHRRFKRNIEGTGFEISKNREGRKHFVRSEVFLYEGVRVGNFICCLAHSCEISALLSFFLSNFHELEELCSYLICILVGTFFLKEVIFMRVSKRRGRTWKVLIKFLYFFFHC